MESGLITQLAVVTVVAAITGMLTRRIGQPSILGYLLAGIIVGPYIPIPLFADPARMNELAEVGVVLVMFAVGLEFRVRRLLDILPLSGLTAGVQIAALAWAGFTVGSFLGWSTAASMCLGAMLSISSTMVVSAVLRTRKVDPDVRSHVFGILVVQDVAAIVLMAVVTALAAGESVGVQSLGLLIAQLAAVIVTMLLGGVLILPRLIRFALKQSDSELLVVLISGAAFGLAMAASEFGYSVALGAFVSGMAVAESGRGRDIQKAIEPLRSLFSAIFFVSIGMTVDPFVAWQSLPLALVLSAVVIATQFISVTGSTVLTGGSMRQAVYSGLALGQIGELSFILATIAIGGGVVPSQTLPALVSVATITAFTTPLLLGRAQFVVEMIDRRLPERFHEVLAAYESFLRSTRNERESSSLRRPAIAVLLDWCALVVVFVVRSTLRPRLDGGLVIAVDLLAVVIATPFVLGLIRSGLKLARGVQARARGGGGATPRARAVEAIALLAVVIGVGLPTAALLQPIADGPWIEVVLLAVLLVVLVVVGLRLGDIKGEYTSGVSRLAIDIADHLKTVAPDLEDTQPLTVIRGPLAGMDYHPIRIVPGSPADGLTLAELDLRCRTGATVVAITRADTAKVLPAGDAMLMAGDVLAVSGSPEAVERAEAVVSGADQSEVAEPETDDTSPSDLDLDRAEPMDTKNKDPAPRLDSSDESAMASGSSRAR